MSDGESETEGRARANDLARPFESGRAAYLSAEQSRAFPYDPGTIPGSEAIKHFFPPEAQTPMQVQTPRSRDRDAWIAGWEAARREALDR